MRLLDQLHEKYIRRRRAEVLSQHLSKLLEKNSSVLDVGCGDGQIAALVERTRTDVKFDGVDVLVRPDAEIPVREFDGDRLPCEDHAYDVVSLIDVLHHTENPRQLLAEASRAARRSIIIKDHLLEGVGARATLAWMDGVGNRRHGVSLPYNYLKNAYRHERSDCFS